MTLFTPHEKIKTKIVAFLFNTRADVLRDEMYRALCLHVLVEADQPCDLGQVTELVAYAISSKAQVNASLQAIVADELTTLVKRGNVNFVDGTYRLNTEDSQVLPSSEEEEELVEIIKKEIRKLAREVKPNITYAEIESLQEFYFEVCELVAKAQIAYLAKDQLELDYISNYELTGLVTQLRIKFEVDKMIDGDKFIERCFLKPPDTLSNYVYLLIKVNIILQLLAWDPELAYLQDKILKNKTLYLDTSVLFPLMLESNPMHEFVLSLLTASVEELGVKLKVQDITIDEYESVIREIDQEFSREHQHLRQIVKICNENNEDPVQFLESGIFIDYLKHHSKHIDLGSWQRYKNNIDRNALISKLKKLNVQFDRDNAYVPYKDYNLIQSNMIRASVDQVKRGKRTQKKSDVTHDVQMYYLIKKNRNRASNEFSLGYDTYLLTMDGSLAHFAKYEGFTWIDTYFIFPNQWYELAFPFLRMKITHNSNLSSVFANNAFSQIFPTLESLIPLKVLGYVFDMGGENLSLGSIQALVEGMFEKRLVERLDPANKDLREREEAQLSVQRMIAEFVVEDQKIVEGLQLKAQELEKQKETLQNQIDEQEEKRKHLEENVSLKEGELVAIDQQFLARQNVDDIYSDASAIAQKNWQRVSTRNRSFKSAA